ncbi:hypothetical protein AZI86_09230 [Bdellovibrio bacteriovorus]|uniref:HTH cro/C1-type domain-containing protein n=1 Tax=Bdellovibrio bacteriovorus TaxID=959 RepID=A0A150WRP4_BDEBC|nr:TIGR02147 family protein [Bdellovibrio bacteriovorus]KYG67181.1 hypothetical protein AZI86_09230 [Bdellovibrio bacteriovorus]
MSQIYEFTKYSDYLESLVTGETKRFSISQLAQFAGVQRPYLSNVLAGRSQLNTEQAFRLGEHLGFDSDAQTYFTLLVEYERASHEKFKSHTLTKIKALQSIALKLEKKLQREISAVDSTMTAEYFSSWELSALHILSSIPLMQKPDQMALALRLPISYVMTSLDRLVAWGLVKQNKNRYEWASGNIHVPATSPTLSMHHRNWREKSVEDARLRPGDTIHFTSVYSMSESDYEKFRLRILDFLKDYNQMAGGSKEEKLVSFNLDFFDVT